MVLDAKNKGRWRRPLLLALVAAIVPAGASAHERFVKHRLKHPLQNDFFLQRKGRMLGMHADLLRISLNVFVVLTGFIVLWYFRQPIDEFIQRRLVRPLGAARKLGPITLRPQVAVNQLACFLTDKPVRANWFRLMREWCVILFLRSPGLVLMYSATTDALVMPSYPLDPASALVFKYLQVGLAILILTQTALPLCGAIIFGTWIYLFRWGWMVAMDATPVLTVAMVYVTSPWQSHRLAITDLTEKQMRWVRLTLGSGLLILGWLKLYNHDLTAGVADNFPRVLDDPMMTLLRTGTSRGLRVERWVAAFGLAEVLSGFLLLIGAFSRVWTGLMAFMFTKLMFADFGWEEIPHIYPIAATLVVMTSNKLTSELDRIEAIEERLGRRGKTGRQVALVVVCSLLLSFLVIFPLLYWTTFLDRSALST